MKKWILCLPIGIVAIGCGDTGDVPTEPAKPASPTASTTPVAPAPAPGTMNSGVPAQVPQPQNTGEAIRANPNLPPAAKDALMGKGR